MIKYLGSKKKLVSWIVDTIKLNFPKTKSILDLFSGTSRVGFALKEQGFKVIANDHNLFAYHLARCYIENDIEEIPKELHQIISDLNNTPGKRGFFTKNYCEDARFFHPDNGLKIDAIRDKINKIKIPETFRSILLVSLMEAADKVDSTCGMQMAYLKTLASRAFLPLNLKMPKLLPKAKYGKGQAFSLDALSAAKNIVTDLSYLDPPYNQHSYRANYHLWETLMLWDQPELYGIAKKRLDCKTIKSDLNSKKKFYEYLENIINALSSKYIILSFSDEGFIAKENLASMLKNFGSVNILEMDYKRYIGAQIGIYNQKGQKVGQIKKLKNKELLFILDKN